MQPYIGVTVRIMNNIRHRTVSLILTAVMLFVMCAAILPGHINAAEKITKTVNISIANKNERGPGYNWANRTDILTLDGLNIETDEPYGLRLPNNCTVILKGDNYIKAAKYGLACSGTVVIKGSGTLTIDAGEIGIYLVSQDSTHKIRLIDGTYKVTAGTYGVYSEYADFSFVGNKMTIDVTGDDAEYAISGRRVNLVGGTFSANGAITASRELTVEGINLDVSANRPALFGAVLSIKDVALTSGGSSITEYNGENAVSGVSTAKSGHHSIIFGESVPAAVDYVCLVILVIGVGAGIFGPALHSKKKKKALYERLAKEGYDVPQD